MAQDGFWSDIDGGSGNPEFFISALKDNKLKYVRLYNINV